MSKFISLIVLLLCCSGQASAQRASQLSYVARDNQENTGRRIVEELCDFYGLTCAFHSPREAARSLDAAASNEQQILGVIAEAPALDVAISPEGRVLWRSIRDRHIPVLILCAEPLTLPWAALGEEEAPADMKFTALAGKPSSWQVTQANPDLTRELTGLSGRVGRHGGYPAVVIDPQSLGRDVVPLLLVQSADGVPLPVYAEWKNPDGPVFFAGFRRETRGDGGLFGPDIDSSLPHVAPILTFLRFAGGQYCWHRRTDYANLVIDDPWLTEPYGCLSYRGLLAEMRKARFHTTIAFVPWNYDRTEQDVATIFREYPEHYSLCVHGNDHDRWEFCRYRTIPGDPFEAKPLHVQEAGIRQGLARMQQFRSLTGLDCDRVMVFPHFIAPVQTLAALKKYNYLMTVNARNLPLDFDPPSGYLSALRSTTLEYGNFASLTRHLPMSRSRAAIALDLFLDNPVIFYEHHGLFRRGMDAFNGTAERVNRIQPSTKWTSLGEIARHLYLQRSRPDGNSDIKAFCRSIELANDQPREMTYSIEKAESSDVPIRHVLVDGAPHPHAVSDGRLRLTVKIEPHRSRRIDIEYEDDFQVSQVDIARSDPRVQWIRALSDLRDCGLSRHRATRTIVDFYYASMLYRLGLKGAAVVCCVVSVAALTGGWKLLKRASRPRPRLDPKRVHILGE